MQPRGSSRVVVEDSDPGKDLQQEQEKEQEPRRFLTSAPYREARVGHATSFVFPIVPTDLGLEDALKQVFGEAPAVSGSQQHPALADKPLQEESGSQQHPTPADNPRQEEAAQPGVAPQPAVAPQPDAAATMAEAQQSAPDQTQDTSKQQGNNNTAVTVKPQYHKKVKRLMLNQADWLWEDGSNPSRRNPLDT
ncbi:hypothetical protein INS49_010274 [Diaporthe citri]|uniref:uncharacterized protein n=1 Tax=Diaporthe citri TaxID=83186 RepID=UPI001C805BBE|nr:uncharacterized protein INS49_010274 [Diaporthe citri]KAG6362045.1 hypothetical protein INS49_010274 [Diaporthe citri]